MVDFPGLGVGLQHGLEVWVVASCSSGLAGPRVWVEQARAVVLYMYGPPAQREALVDGMSSISLSEAAGTFDLALQEQRPPWSRTWLARGLRALVAGMWWGIGSTTSVRLLLECN